MDRMVRTVASSGSNYGSSTVDKALDILAALAGSPEGLTNPEISGQLSLDKSTSRRLLATLEKRGCVMRTSGRRYTIGHQIQYWAWTSGTDIRLILQPILQELVDLTKESASFSILRRDSFYCVSHVPSPHELSFSPSAGATYPINAGASGIAIWAFLPLRDREWLLDHGNFPSFTKHTPTSREALLDELGEAARRGYGVSAGSRTPGGCSVACPVIAGDRVIGAIALSAAELRCSVEHLTDYVPYLQRAADELLAALHWGSAESTRSPRER